MYKKQNFKTENTIIKLEAQQNSHVNSNIRTILNSDVDGELFLDEKKYHLNLFKSIVDTLKGGYTLERLGNNSIKIVRNNSNLKE